MNTTIAPNWVDTPDSSQIAGFGYTPATQQLTIKFKHGGSVYDYQNVPQAVFDGLNAAESKGRYFGQNIRHAPYPYKRRP